MTEMQTKSTQPTITLSEVRNWILV